MVTYLVQNLYGDRIDQVLNNNSQCASLVGLLAPTHTAPVPDHQLLCCLQCRLGCGILGNKYKILMSLA